MTTLISLFIANAIAHIVSFLRLRKIKSPKATGVILFALINAAIAFTLWQDFSWAHWPALIFPAVGGLGLLTGTILKGKGTWIDYVILVLDIVIIGIITKKFLIL